MFGLGYLKAGVWSLKANKWFGGLPRHLGPLVDEGSLGGGHHHRHHHQERSHRRVLSPTFTNHFPPGSHHLKHLFRVRFFSYFASRRVVSLRRSHGVVVVRLTAAIFVCKLLQDQRPRANSAPTTVTKQILLFRLPQKYHDFLN